AAIAQMPFATGKVYGVWTPIDGGTPYGPFVNRNHFAGWMLMGLPLTFGLLCAMLSRAMRGVRPYWRDRLMWLSTPDASLILLTGAATIVMAISLVLTLSLSGMAALAAAIAITAVCVIRRRWTRGRTAAAIAYLALLFLVAYGWAGSDVIASRFGENDWHELDARRGDRAAGDLRLQPADAGQRAAVRGALRDRAPRRAAEGRSAPSPAGIIGVDLPLRIAFDLDGVLADMEGELVRQAEILFGESM